MLNTKERDWASSLGYHNIINKCYLHNRIKRLLCTRLKRVPNEQTKVEWNWMDEWKTTNALGNFSLHTRESHTIVLLEHSLLLPACWSVCVKLCQMNKVIIFNVAWTFALNEDQNICSVKVNFGKLFHDISIFFVISHHHYHKLKCRFVSIHRAMVT